jgi:hypothetical protein
MGACCITDKKLSKGKEKRGKYSGATNNLLSCLRSPKLALKLLMIESRVANSGAPQCLAFLRYPGVVEFLLH